MEAISVSVRRGSTVEAKHRVHAVAVRDGEVVAAAGDPALVCLFRSSAKPIQALLLARARPDLGDREIAIACASHRAEPAQIEAVRSLLAKGPATEDDLECGEQEGRAPGAIHHNCSGKHAGFLAVCRARSWETVRYRLAEHPLQQELHEEVARAAELADDGDPDRRRRLRRRDVRALARADGAGRSPASALDGAERILAAMRAHPELVGGEGSLDTDLMRRQPAGRRKAAPRACCAQSRPTEPAMPSSPRTATLALSARRSRTFLEVDLGNVPVESSRGEVVGEVVVGMSEA